MVASGAALDTHASFQNGLLTSGLHVTLVTTLQSLTDTKLIPQSFWPCHENQDDSNDTLQPICEFQVDFPLLWIRINLDKP